ncbi:uncharacterized protein [Physcomitrium patens]|uniref:uncharacterized protein isoform X2 n=1 Tax=Physcomitrium patens TaxID=3218 RepID=UPI003CCDA97B
MAAMAATSALISSSLHSVCFTSPASFSMNCRGGLNTSRSDLDVVAEASDFRMKDHQTAWTCIQ